MLFGRLSVRPSEPVEPDLLELVCLQDCVGGGDGGGGVGGGGVHVRAASGVRKAIRPRSSDQQGRMEGGAPSFITGGGSRKKGGRGRRSTPSPPYPYACAHICTTWVFLSLLTN